MAKKRLSPIEIIVIVGMSAIFYVLLIPTFRHTNHEHGMDRVFEKTDNLGVALTKARTADRGLFPQGTVAEGSDLPVEKRLSWVATLRPFLDCKSEADAPISFGKPWDSPENIAITTTGIAMLRSPISRSKETNRTDYVGMAGVGPDAAKLPTSDPNAGIFGYDRRTGERDIIDGLSGTILLIGVESRIGPWAKGGLATVRGFAAHPYLKGPDGFGSNWENYVAAAMADGSARFIATDVDSQVLERLATIDGGEINRDTDSDE